MSQLRAILMLFLALFVFAQGTFAGSPDVASLSAESGVESNAHTPYISMNIGVEISGLETAAEQAAEGLKLMGESLQKLADKPEMNPENRKQIVQVLNRVDQLGESLAGAVDRLPDTVEKSMVPVVNASHTLSAQIRQTVIIAFVALILIVLAALVAAYYFVLAPGTRSVIKTAELLDELANTLKTTAEIVEISSVRNVRVLEAVQKVQDQSNLTP